MNLALTLVIQGWFFPGRLAVMKFFWPWLMGAIAERQKKIAEGWPRPAKARRNWAKPRRAPRKSSGSARARGANRRSGRQTSNELVDEAKARPPPKRHVWWRRRTTMPRSK